jgi:hypothetical protein
MSMCGAAPEALQRTARCCFSSQDWKAEQVVFRRHDPSKCRWDRFWSLYKTTADFGRKLASSSIAASLARQ